MLGNWDMFKLLHLYILFMIGTIMNNDIPFWDFESNLE